MANRYLVAQLKAVTRALALERKELRGLQRDLEIGEAAVKETNELLASTRNDELRAALRNVLRDFRDDVLDTRFAIKDTNAALRDLMKDLTGIKEEMK